MAEAGLLARYDEAEVARRGRGQEQEDVVDGHPGVLGLAPVEYLEDKKVISHAVERLTLAQAQLNDLLLIRLCCFAALNGLNGSLNRRYFELN